MKMEQSQLSDHEKFIVMVDKSRTGLTGSMRCFIGFKDVLTALHEMSKSDSETMTWNGKDVVKPIKRNEAQRLLDNFKKSNQVNVRGSLTMSELKMKSSLVSLPKI